MAQKIQPSHKVSEKIIYTVFEPKQNRPGCFGFLEPQKNGRREKSELGSWYIYIYKLYTYIYNILLRVTYSLPTSVVVRFQKHVRIHWIFLHQPVLGDNRPGGRKVNARKRLSPTHGKKKANQNLTFQFSGCLSHDGSRGLVYLPTLIP